LWNNALKIIILPPSQYPKLNILNGFRVTNIVKYIGQNFSSFHVYLGAYTFNSCAKISLTMVNKKLNEKEQKL
jgi:hypothetical protein